MLGDIFTLHKKNIQPLKWKPLLFLGSLSAFILLLCIVLSAFIVENTWIKVTLTLVSIIPTILLIYIFGVHCQDLIRILNKKQLIIRRVQRHIRYLESVIQDSTDIIFTIDIEGYILKFNSGSELHFGYTQNEIVGKPLSQLFINEADEQKILNSVLLSGKSINEEVPMKTNIGEIILLNLSMSEMKNEQGEIIGLVTTAKDITDKKKLEMELRKKNELLEKLAVTDSLTELYNLRHFYNHLVKEWRRLKRNPERKLSLIMIDIDHFKELNDTEGHQMGDQVLRSLARVIKVCIRKDIDAGYRYGGDEFVVILPDTDKNQAHVVAERIHKQFNAFKFGQTNLSIGITEARINESQNDLIRRVDEAMYASKRTGRGKITIG